MTPWCRLLRQERSWSPLAVLAAKYVARSPRAILHALGSALHVHIEDPAKLSRPRLQRHLGVGPHPELVEPWPVHLHGRAVPAAVRIQHQGISPTCMI